MPSFKKVILYITPMKKLARFVLVSAAFSAHSYAAPFLAIGDGAELFVTGTVGVRADDNIYLSNNRGNATGANGIVIKGKENDIIFDVNPGVELIFGKGSQVSGALTLVDAFANYKDNSDLNTNLFAGDFVTRFDDGKMKLGFNVSYHELNQNTVGARALTRRDVFNTAANGEVAISAITSVSGGVDFVHENYKRDGYTDSDNLSIPLNFYYKWTPKVDLSGGYRYRDYQVDMLGQDSTDHFFNVGARGEFSPKFTGRVAVGVTTRNVSAGKDYTTLGLDGSFAYEISPKTRLEFGVANDFGTSPQGQQQENFTLNAMVSTKLSTEWSVNAGLSYRAIDYKTSATQRGRSDDYFEGQLGGAYIVNSSVQVVGAYVYRTYSSALVSSEFTNNVFSIAANLRY